MGLFGSTPPPPPTRSSADRADLAAAVIEGRTFREVTVPGTKVTGRLRVLSRAEARQVRADVRAALDAKGITANAPGVLEGFQEWRDERALRTVALAVRAATPVEDRDPPALAPLSEWEQCTDVQLGALWDDYQDLEALLDPYGSNAPLTSEEARQVVAAAKKKDGATLMSFGSHTLARFAITSASESDAPPST